jgi:acyl dehydratase
VSETVAIETIDEQLLEEFRMHIGEPLRLRRGQAEATIDNLRWFAYGIADPNPLWTDEEYGRRSVFGRNVAPPTFYYAIYYGGILPGPGLYATHAGIDARFRRRIRVGDAGFRVEGTLKDAELVTSSRGITRILSRGYSNYLRADGSGGETSVAEVEHLFWRTAPSGANKGLRYEPRESATWSDDELEEIGEAVYAESAARRGADPRYWDDVAVGDTLGSIVRGPYSLMDQVAYYVGERSKAPRAFDGWWLHTHDDPGSQPTENPFGVHRHGAYRGGHWDAQAAHEAGMPGAYDDGNQRIGVVTAIVTNWMGDAAFLRELSVRQTKPVVPGDVLRISGVVDERLEVDQADPDTGTRQRPVKVRVEARNQLDQVVQKSTAVVDLPMRGS